jgi:hypothetical protein
MADRNYRLIVEGELNDAFRHTFHGMTLTRIGGNTALAGNVRDQAELQGLLRRVSGLGLTLLEAGAIEDLPDKLPENRSADADPAENRSSESRSYRKEPTMATATEERKKKRQHAT